MVDKNCYDSIEIVVRRGDLNRRAPLILHETGSDGSLKVIDRSHINANPNPKFRSHIIPKSTPKFKS